MSRRHFSSTATATFLTGGITAGATTFTVGATSGWPTSYPFTLILDVDTASEEVVNVTNVSGSNVTVVRGQDGTTGVSHSAGATVKHGVSARDFDEPNAHIDEGDGDNPHGLPDAAWDLETAWQSWSPSWTGLTVGNGTVTAKYRRIGDTIQFRLSFAGGSTSSVSASASVRFSLPAAANVSAGEYLTFTANEFNLGGTRAAVAFVDAAPPASEVFLQRGATGTYNSYSDLATGNVTTGYYYAVSGTYEAA